MLQNFHSKRYTFIMKLFLTVMRIKKVWIETGCTACGVCESICPEVFTVEDEAKVNTDVNFDGYTDQIQEAAESCPVEVIKYEANEEDE